MFSRPICIFRKSPHEKKIKKPIVRFLTEILSRVMRRSNITANSWRVARTIFRTSTVPMLPSRLVRPAITIPSLCVPTVQYLSAVNQQSVRWYASKKAKGGKGSQKKASKEAAEIDESDKNEDVELKFDEQQLVNKMNQVTDWLKKDLAGIRIGRANPG